MEILKSNFDVTYQITDCVIKSVGAGVMEGNKYGASIQLTCSNLYERKNSKTEAMDEVIEEVVFKLICEDDTQAGFLSDIIKEKRKNGEVITLKGTLPNQNNQVKVFTDVREFISTHSKKSDTTKKAS